MSNSGNSSDCEDYFGDLVEFGAVGGNDISDSWLFEKLAKKNIKPCDESESDADYDDENYYLDHPELDAFANIEQFIPSKGEDLEYQREFFQGEPFDSESGGDSGESKMERLEPVVQRKLRRSDRILAGLAEDQKTGLFCDVILEIDGEEFPLHKGVFKACSTYFETMFTGNFGESSLNKIRISDVTKEAFRIILDFTYGRPIDFDLENIYRIYLSAEMLCMDQLVEECRMKIREIFVPYDVYINDLDKFVEHCAKVMFIAEHMGLTEFCSTLVKYVKDRIEINSNRSEILVKMTPNLLLPLLQLSSKWDSPKEGFKVTFLRRWIDYDPQDRLVHWKTILESINFELLSPELTEVLGKYLESSVKKHLGSEAREEFNAQFIKFRQRVTPKSRPYIVEVALFFQDPTTKLGDFRICKEAEESGDTTWVCKSLDLQCEIVQSVKVNNQLVLFGRDSFYHIPFDTMDDPLERRKAHVLLQFAHFVAFAHKTQVIVAGMSDNKEDNGAAPAHITLLAIHYWKQRPEVVKLFYFSCDGHSCARPIALSCFNKMFYVFATNPDKCDGSDCALLVNSNRQNATIPVRGLAMTKLRVGKYTSNRLFLHVSGEKVYLIDQGTSLFSGISVTLPEFREGLSTKKITTIKAPRCKTRIHDEIEDVLDESSAMESVKKEESDREWIGSVRGTLLANCKMADEHLLLVGQGTHLTLFSMKSLENFQFLKLLPKFDDHLPNLNLLNTNFFLRIFSK